MVKLNKIYTRTGDAGTTGLVDGSRRSKADARMHAIGEVDEANSALGIAIAALERADGDVALVAGLRRIQNDLFDLGADIATPGEDFTPGEMTPVAARRRRRCTLQGRFRVVPSGRWYRRRPERRSIRSRLSTSTGCLTICSCCAA